MPNLVDFRAQRFIFPHFGTKKTQRKPGLLLDATRREHVHVGGLVATVLKAGDLDPALPDQRLHTVIELAETDSELSEIDGAAVRKGA